MHPYEHIRGHVIADGICSWDQDRTMLYAVGVAAGLQDASDELEFTTENTPGQPQQVIPGFLCTLHVEGDWLGVLGWDGPGGIPVGLVHGEQSVTVHSTIPPTGTARLRRFFEGVYDKGSGALVVIDTEISCAETGRAIGTLRSCLFAQGKGGFGGPRAPAGDPNWTLPLRDPDLVITLPTGRNQSLIYRLMGDHREHGTLLADAIADGFERPVFYGLGSFGVACRALIKGLCEGSAERFGHIEGRFSKPVYPGDDLVTQIWPEEGGGQFRMLANGERVAFDRGRFCYRP